MIYDVNTRELFTNDRKLLKKLDCPLHKAWSELTVLTEDESKKHCASCQKCVVNLAGMSEQEVEALLTQLPGCCVYVPPAADNVKITGHIFARNDDPCPFRRIYTARGEDAINQGVLSGFWPLVKQVERSPKISTWMAVYQHAETGEIKTSGDGRWPPKAPWKLIIDSFAFYPYVFEHEIAAYLISPDLKVGERVFLTDLIEDEVAIFGNQGHTYRLECAYAIWNGKDFEIEWEAETQAARWVG